MIKAIIVDDHQLVAEGFKQLIDNNKTADVVAITGTIAAACPLIRDHQPDLLMLDVALPGSNGIDALPQLKALCPHMRVIIITMYAEPAVIRQAIDAHADGYLLKSAAPGELVEAINTVMSGNTFICREAKDIINGIPEDLPAITLRERDILPLLANGYSIKETADRLCLAFETVHSYTKSLRQKLHCNNMASLVRKAIELHLI